MIEQIENLDKKFKKFKLKTRRAWHRFDQVTGASKLAKKVVFWVGLNLVALSGNTQALQAQTLSRKQEVKETHMLAKAEAAKATIEYNDFIEQHQMEIQNRQETFARALYKITKENVERVKTSKKNSKYSVLRSLAKPYAQKGMRVYSERYCSTAGLSSFMKAVDINKSNEYEFLIDCLKRPNSCKYILEDLQENYGKQTKSNDVKRDLAKIYEKNKNAVCIVLRDSKTNPNSGMHFIMVLPGYVAHQKDSIAIDTTVVSKQTNTGVVLGFNREVMQDADTYFTNTSNKGRIFNVTEMVESDLIYEMYQEYLDNKSLPKVKSKENFIIGQPVAQTQNTTYKWHKVTKEDINRGVALAVRNVAKGRKTKELS